MSTLRNTVLELAGAYATSGAITAEVKTNLGPAFTIYSGAGDGRPGLLELLGVKASLTIYRDGTPVAGYGEPPATEPLVAAALVAVLAIAGALLVLAVRRL